MYNFIKGTNQKRYRFNTKNYISNSKPVQQERVPAPAPAPAPAPKPVNRGIQSSLVTIKGASNTQKKVESVVAAAVAAAVNRGTSSSLVRIK
jgi:hypothetical protein